MIRARFHTNPKDWRSVNWPAKHPYWRTGHTEEYSVVVAYADDIEEILRNWPDATDIEARGADEYLFSGRFPKPDWFVE